MAAEVVLMEAVPPVEDTALGAAVDLAVVEVVASVMVKTVVASMAKMAE